MPFNCAEDCFIDVQSKLNAVITDAVSGEILSSLHSTLGQNPKAREFKIEESAREHFARFDHCPQFKLIRDYAKAYRRWVMVVYDPALDEEADSRLHALADVASFDSFESTAAVYLDTAQNSFYFLTPSFLSLVNNPKHRAFSAAAQLRKLLRRNTFRLMDRRRTELHGRVNDDEESQVNFIAQLQVAWDPMFSGCKDFRCQRDSIPSFRSSRWYSLLDSVAFAFPELHGEEGVVLKGLRENAMRCDITKFAFATRANPDAETFPEGSLTLSRRSSPEVRWTDIYNDLNALLTCENKETVSRIDVIACVFGNYLLDMTKMANALHQNICYRIQILVEKLREEDENFVCRHAQNHANKRGNCECQLGWIPGAVEFLERELSAEPGEVERGSVSSTGGLEIPVEDPGLKRLFEEQ